MTPYMCSPTRVFLTPFPYSPRNLFVTPYISSPTRIFLTAYLLTPYITTYMTPYMCSPTRVFLTPYLDMFPYTCTGWQKCFYIPYDTTHMFWHPTMGRLQLVGSLELDASFAEYRLFYRALLQKRPIILRSLLIVATA